MNNSYSVCFEVNRKRKSENKNTKRTNNNAQAETEKLELLTIFLLRVGYESDWLMLRRRTTDRNLIGDFKFERVTQKDSKVNKKAES